MINAFPLVAPKQQTFPTIIFSSALYAASFGTDTTILPPLNPLPRPSFASPERRIVRPFGMNAPKLCPPPPVAFTVKLSSSREFPNAFWISEPRIVPTVLSVEETFISNDPFFENAGRRSFSSTVFESWKS